MVIGDYWWLNYHRLLVAILLVPIVNYFIVGHWWLLMAILLVVLSPKRRGPQSDRTPWQYTDPSQSPSC
jgi:hypothetical protein